MPQWEWEAPRALAPWVAGFAASADEGAPEPVRVLPDGGADLLFSVPAGGGDWRAEVFGPKSRALIVADAARMEKLAVRLRPGAAALWLGVPARELSDRALPLAAFWGRASDELCERLTCSRSRKAVLAHALLARRPESSEASALARLAASRLESGLALPALLRELGIGERRLERLFAEHVGLPPKRFARIVRLLRVQRALQSGARQLEAALAAGYYDQAHLHRDSRSIAGVAPAAL